MIKLSVAIITFNEENNIARCISSVKDLADEILVVDSFSTDKTLEICKQYGARIIERGFEGYIEQKNFALKNATHDHVLSIDGDEALDEELQKSIKAIKENWKADGYMFNRLTSYCGQWVRHCGWYPDTKLRLWKRSHGTWSGANPHDIVKMNDQSKIEFLKGDILHYSYPSVSSHVNQTNNFTTIAAREAFDRGVRSSSVKPLVRGVLKFFRDYFLKLGFLDGRYGLIICTINGLSAFLKYTKVKELQNDKVL